MSGLVPVISRATSRTVPEPAPFVPACMDADELAAWAHTNEHMKVHRAVWACSDCTLGFAAEMRAAGRCNGTPKGIEEDEEMDGNGSMAALAAATAGVTRTNARSASLPLDVTPPPCASCVHEPVCSLRQAIEKFGRIEMTAPVLPDGLGLSLRAVVECGQYLRDRARPAPVRALTSEQRGAANRNAARAPMTEQHKAHIRAGQIAAAERARQGLVSAGAGE